MDWLTTEDAAEVGQSARKMHAVEIPELGRTVGLLEATGTQMMALDVLLPDGTIPYASMHAILPAVVVGEDRRPLFPGSELVASLPGTVIEALMREWLQIHGMAGAAPVVEPVASEGVEANGQGPKRDAASMREAMLANMRAAGHQV